MTITQTILMVIVQNGGNSAQDLREIFDDEYDRKQISNALHRLKADGLILLVSDSDGERLYMATDKGRSVAAELEAELESQDNAAEPQPTQPETEQVEAVPATEVLRSIREALGDHNDYDKPLVECVLDLVAKAGNSNLEDQINEALGDFGDPAAPVVSRVQALRDDRASLYQDYVQILEAAGDSDSLTFTMLLKQIRDNRRDAEEAREVRQYLNGFGDRSLTDAVQAMLVQRDNQAAETAIS